MSTQANFKEKNIPLGKPVFDHEEVEAVSKIFETSWILDGPTVRKFEECFKQYTGAAHADSVSNCTTGMHLALAALELPENSEVLIPAFNFVADGLSILQARLRPCFVEVDPETANLDPKDLKKRINRKTKAILVLHYAGLPANMAEIMKIARENDLKVVEDAAHALGSSYGDKKIGAIGDATVFSFGPLKMITTGMGGMVTSNDPQLTERIVALRSYGMNKSMWNRKEAKRPWQYAVSVLGHNFRMTDFQAAMGLMQMKKLDSFIAQRRKLVARYEEILKDVSGVQFFKQEPSSDPVPLYYVVKINDSARPSLRDDLATLLNAKGIGASVHWDPPLHQHPLYQDLKLSCYEFPLTEMLAKQIISLPLSPVMTEEDVDYIALAIKNFIQGETSL